MDVAKSDPNFLVLILFLFRFIVANEMQKCALLPKVIFLNSPADSKNKCNQHGFILGESQSVARDGRSQK